MAATSRSHAFAVPTRHQHLRMDEHGHGSPRSSTLLGASITLHLYPSTQTTLLPVLLFVLTVYLTIRTAISFLRRTKHRHPFPQHADSIPTPLLPARAHLGHAVHMGPDFTTGTAALVTGNPNDRGMTALWIVGVPTISVLHHDDVRTVFRASSYRKEIGLFSHHFNMFLGSKSLIRLMGREWRTHRGRVHRAFVPAALRENQPAITRVALELVRSLADRYDLSGSGRKGVTIDVLPIMKMATMDVFGLTGIGHDFACRNTLSPSPIVSAFDYLSRDYTRRVFQDTLSLDSQCYWIPTERNRTYMRRQRMLLKFLRGIIKERRDAVVSGTVPRRASLQERRASLQERGANRQQPQEDDLLTTIIRADYDEKKAKGMSLEETELSDEVLVDVVRTLLFAGYDTTSTTLSYALYAIAGDKQVEQRMLDEITASPLASASPENLDPEVDLPYTTAVVTETLRLYSPAPQTFRTLEKDTVVGGTVLDEGTHVMLPLWFIHRDERNFDRPLEFIPERWVRQEEVKTEEVASANPSGGGVENGSSSSQQQRRRQRKRRWVNRSPNDPQEEEEAAQTSSIPQIPPANREAFFPFSGGARSCVGRRYAIQEAVTVLAILIKSYTFDVPDDYVLEPMQSGPVQKPKNGMPLVVRER